MKDTKRGKESSFYSKKLIGPINQNSRAYCVCMCNVYDTHVFIRTAKYICEFNKCFCLKMKPENESELLHIHSATINSIVVEYHFKIDAIFHFYYAAFAHGKCVCNGVCECVFVTIEGNFSFYSVSV